VHDLVTAGTCRPESDHGEKLSLCDKSMTASPLPSTSCKSPRRPAGGGGGGDAWMHRGPSGRYPGPQLPHAPFGWHSLQYAGSDGSRLMQAPDRSVSYPHSQSRHSDPDSAQLGS